MKIARTLESGEVVLLFDLYRYTINNPKTEDKSRAVGTLYRQIISSSSLKLKGLADIYYRKLREKRLCIEETSDAAEPPYYTLTELGFEFCKFINNYDELKKEIENQES